MPNDNDNVTPFRRPPKRPQVRASAGGKGGGVATPRGKAMLVQGLALAGFALLFFVRMPPQSYVGLAVAIAAVFVAASNRYEAMPWARTHQEHALRTVAIGGAIWVLGTLLGLLGPLGIATFYVHAFVALWAVIRAGVGFVLAALRKPIPRPTGVLF